jgi:hypothetical protein
MFKRKLLFKLRKAVVDGESEDLITHSTDRNKSVYVILEMDY